MKFDIWNKQRRVVDQETFTEEDDCNWDNRECEFEECDPSRHMHGDDSCWKEHCWNDCGRYECLEWHTTGQDDTGDWEWQKNACPESEDKGWKTAVNKSKVTDQLAQSFEAYCPNGACRKLA